MIQKMNIVRRGNVPVSAMAPADSGKFSRLEPYGASVDSARCLVVDGKFYPLAHGCPDDGLPLWTEAGVEAKEIALDEALSLLPAEFVAEKFPGHKPWAVRLANREADDAEADARAAAASKRQDADDLAALAEAKRAAADAAVAAFESAKG